MKHYLCWVADKDDRRLGCDFANFLFEDQIEDWKIEMEKKLKEQNYGDNFHFRIERLSDV